MDITVTETDTANVTDAVPVTDITDTDIANVTVAATVTATIRRPDT
ncbi:hypothetical protein [Parvibaculum sp.]